MLLQPVKTPGIAHNAYVVGSDGVAAVIDPRRDVGEYLEMARAQGFTIRYVLETHRQEDFALGSRALKREAEAAVVGGDHGHFAHADRRLAEGEELRIGGLRLRLLATPGHTPESVSYAAFVPDCPDRPWAVFTGDALFVGETGRTDLADPARTAENAGLLYDAVHAKLLPLGDHTLLFPGHGAGSVCGGAIADRDQSTLGIEQASNPVFTLSRDAFIRHKLAERLPRPPYFVRMERLNATGGPEPMVPPERVPTLQPAAFAAACRDGIVIDARSPEAFAGGHVPGAYSVWLAGMPVFGGWVADPDTPIYLVVGRPEDLPQAVHHLGRIGVDRIGGVLAKGFESWRNAGLPIATAGTLGPRDLRDRLGDVAVLDVREISEFEAGHIAGARHRYVGDLVRQGPDGLGLDPGRPLAVTCSVGHRASLGVSALLRRGYRQVFNLLGGMTAWSALNFAKDSGAPTAP